MGKSKGKSAAAKSTGSASAAVAEAGAVPLASLQAAAATASAAPTLPPTVPPPIPGPSSASSAAVSSAASVAKPSPSSPSSRSSAARCTRHLNCTNALSSLFLAYAGFSMWTLYRIAVPTIPSALDAQGRKVPAYEPLWAAAPGLVLEVHLSTTPSGGTGGGISGSGRRGVQGSEEPPQADSVHILTVRDLPYAWNLSEVVDLDLGIELAEGYRVTTSTALDAPGSSSSSSSSSSSRAIVSLLPAVRAGDLADAVAWLEQHGGRSEGVGRSLVPLPPALGNLYASLPPNITSSTINQTATLLAPAGIRVRCLSRAGTGSGASGSGTGEEGGPSMSFTGGAKAQQHHQQHHQQQQQQQGARGVGAGDPGIDFTDIAPLCVKLARSCRTSKGGQGARSGGGADALDQGERAALRAKAAAGDIVRKGFLPTLASAVKHSVSQLLGGRSAVGHGGQGVQQAQEGQEEEDGAVAAALEYAAGGLLLAESSSEGARKVARALAQGQPVYAHATIRWQEGGTPSPSPLSPSERRLTTATKLTSSAPYQPGRPVRFLWADVLGGQSSTAALHVAEWIGVPAGVYRQILARPRLGEEKVRRAVRAAALAKEGAGSVSLPAPPAAPVPSSSAGSAERGRGPAPSAPGLGQGEEIPHWLGSLSLTLVMQTESIPKARVPPEIAPFLSLHSSGSGYSPLLTSNPVRPLRDRYIPLNSSLIGLHGGLPLKLRLSAISAGTWRLMSVMDQSLTTQRSLGATEKDTDDVIRLLAETPLWLLALTFAVSFIHLLFDVLAFKNDVSFWASPKSLKGISVRSLGTQFCSQCVISLYLWREGSSLLVLLPQAASTALLLWKMAKASGLVLEVKYHVLPLLRHDPVLAATASEGSASVYDRQAVGTMITLLMPLLAGYAAYTLLYAQHASWADWALGTAVSAVYSLGFALMTPQLWINYRLRSVAHLPWRVLGYRFFNTIIDDLFAAIIRMPLLHRISVFRDDIIFVIYMMQRCLYPVDSSRPAEAYDDEAGAEAGGDQEQKEHTGAKADKVEAQGSEAKQPEAGSPSLAPSTSTHAHLQAAGVGQTSTHAEAVIDSAAQPTEVGEKEAAELPMSERGPARAVSVSGPAAVTAGIATGTVSQQQQASSSAGKGGKNAGKGKGGGGGR